MVKLYFQILVLSNSDLAFWNCFLFHKTSLWSLISSCISPVYRVSLEIVAFNSRHRGLSLSAASTIVFPSSFLVHGCFIDRGAAAVSWGRCTCFYSWSPILRSVICMYMHITICGVFIMLRAPWRCCRHPRPGPSWVLCAAHISHHHPREPEAGGQGSWPGQDGGRVWRHLSHTSAWSVRWDPSPQSQPLLESASRGLSSSRLPLRHQDLSQTGCVCSQGWSLRTCVPLSEHLYEEWGPKWGAVTSAQALCWAVPGTVSWNLSAVPSSSSHLESCF